MTEDELLTRTLDLVKVAAKHNEKMSVYLAEYHKRRAEYYA